MFDQQFKTEHRRLAILRHLAADAAYTSNASILLDVANGVGATTTADQLTATLAWLEEQGLATVKDHGDLVVVTATARGVDVGAGRATHPGVKRPSAR
jgi:hypothetical protein